MLRAFFINATSLKKHINQIRIFLRDNPSYHLFGVAETRFDSSVADDVIQIEGFKVFRQDRNLHGGGVAFYVRSNFTCEILESSDTQVCNKPGKPEYIFCFLKSGSSEPMLVSVIYRPPDVPFIKNTNFADKLKFHCSNYSRKIIMGILNANLLQDDCEANYVRKLSAELSLQLAQHGQTNHIRISHTWIDVILADENDNT